MCVKEQKKGIWNCLSQLSGSHPSGVVDVLTDLPIRNFRHDSLFSVLQLGLSLAEPRHGTPMQQNT